MRLAFWRAGKVKAAVQRAVPKAVDCHALQPIASRPHPNPATSICARSGQALVRKHGWIIVPTLLALVLSVTAVNLVTPRYKSEARILIDGRENMFLRPNGERNEERTALDPEAVTSQVQLVLSRDLAREVIEKNKLAERPEFDPVLQGLSPLKSLLALFGIGRDPFSLTPEERVLDAYYDRFTAYAVDKSRVIVIEFQSRDPELAARVANSIAEGYLVLQQSARQEQAKSAGQWLSGEIDSLRKKVADAESRVEDFRSKSSLFVGTNNTTLSNQQMGEINTQLNNARALKSDAESKARLIREMLQSGKPIEASEVLNSELIRRLSEQRVDAARAAGRAVLDAARRPSAHQGIEGAARRSRPPDARRGQQAVALARQRCAHRRRPGRRPERQPRSVEEAGGLDQRPGRPAPRAGARGQGAARPAGILSGEISRGHHPREHRRRPRRRPDHFPRQRVQYPGLSEEAADRADRDAGDPDAQRRRDRDRRIAAHDCAARRRLRFAPAPAAMDDARARAGAGAAVAAEPASRKRARGGARLQRSHHRSRPMRRPAPNEIEQLAADLRDAGDAARKVTILGTASGEGITLTALTLARLIARDARVVMVDLAASSPMMSAESVDPGAPGLAELMQGEASFAQIITKDRLSRVHLVNAGRPGFDRALAAIAAADAGDRCAAAGL